MMLEIKEKTKRIIGIALSSFEDQLSSFEAGILAGKLRRIYLWIDELPEDSPEFRKLERCLIDIREELG